MGTAAIVGAVIASVYLLFPRKERGAKQKASKRSKHSQDIEQELGGVARSNQVATAAAAAGVPALREKLRRSINTCVTSEGV